MTTLDNFRKDAKRWLKALRAADAGARARFERAYPGAPAEPTLRDVQHALAREQGAVSWVALRDRLDRERQAPASDAPLQALLQAADRRDAAAVIDLAERHPEIVSARGTLDGHDGLRTALHFGIHDAAVVEALLDHGADPNVRDEGDNAFPLHFAVEGGDLAVATMLVEHGADPIGTGDGHELDVIGWAAVFGKGDPALIDYLLAHGSRHNILSAVAMGDVGAIRAIAAADRSQIDRGMDRTNKRRRPLHLAVVKRQPQALAALIALGADLDAEDAGGLTALDQAALDGQDEMAEALIAAGATLRLPAAIALSRDDAIAALVRADPDGLRPGGRWSRVLVRAAEKGSARVIETLIRHGASVDVRDDPETAVDGTKGYTALHAAAWNNNLDAVRVLLAHGADVRAREDKYCATPAGWADYAGHREARDLIMTGPIDIFDAITLERPDLIPGILARDPGAASRPFRAYATCKPQDGDKLPLEVAIACRQSEAADMLRKSVSAPAADSIAARLDRYGASKAPLAPTDARTEFVEACRRMDRQAVREAVGRDPSLLRWPEPIFGAAARDRADAVELLLDLGVPVEIEAGNGQRLLHAAAGANALSVVRLLLARGAVVDPREPARNATPFGFAAHGQHRAMMDLLAPVTRDVRVLAVNGYVDRLREIFAGEPRLARQVNEDGDTLLWWLGPDESRALEVVELLLEHGADAAHRRRDGTTAADWARTCAMPRVAARLARAAASSAGPREEST